MITIGLDPSSAEKGNGVAIYDNGNLVSLDMMKNVEIVRFLEKTIKSDHVIFSIENVLAQSFIYGRNKTGKISVDQNISVKIGRCQQAQRELMWWLDDFSVPYVLHGPSKSNWSKNRPLFEKITGWEGKSNEDTRSAAYFGYLQEINTSSSSKS